MSPRKCTDIALGACPLLFHVASCGVSLRTWRQYLHDIASKRHYNEAIMLVLSYLFWCNTLNRGINLGILTSWEPLTVGNVRQKTLFEILTPEKKKSTRTRKHEEDSVILLLNTWKSRIQYFYNVTADMMSVQNRVSCNENADYSLNYAYSLFQK